MLLLTWFSLDMIGVSFGNSYLVTRSFQDDGLFFFIFLICIALFINKENIGKYVLLIWLTLWFVTQFIFHYLRALMGNGESIIRYC
jgi:hypothetical protein